MQCVDHRPVRLLQTVWFQQHIQVYDIPVQRAIGNIRQVIPVEGIITTPAEQSRKALPFLIQYIAVKQGTVFYQGSIIVGISTESRSQYGTVGGGLSLAMLSIFGSLKSIE